MKLLLVASVLLGTTFSLFSQKIDDFPFAESDLYGFIPLEHAVIEICDINEDGLVDILFSGGNNRGMSELKLYLGNIDKTFSPDTMQDITSFDYGSAKFGDIDNDNDKDLIIMGQTSDQHGLQDIHTGDIEVDDFNGDGLMDVFLIGAIKGQLGFSGVYFNQGNLTFSEVIGSDKVLPLLLSTSLLVDLNGDGKKDLITTGGNNGKLYNKVYLRKN